MGSSEFCPFYNVILFQCLQVPALIALFVDHFQDFLAQELETFCAKFLDKFDTELKNNIATGRVLNDNEIVMNYVRTYFGKYL